jgi:hypothetical protein
MTDRGIALLAGALVVAAVLGMILFTGAMGMRFEAAGEARRPGVFVGDRPPPAARTIEQVQARLPAAVRPIVPVQRQVASTFRDAAAYLLVLLGVAAALVFARGAVTTIYRASLGGWRVHARALVLGGALLAIMASALFLLFVVMLGSAIGVDRAGAGPGGGPGSGPAIGIAVGPFLQVGVTAVSVAVVLVGLVGLVGLAAASWRLGDAILSLRPLTRLAQGTPATLVALLGVSLIYLLAQVPFIGPMIGVAAVAYAIGSVAAARLGHVSTTAASP